MFTCCLHHTSSFHLHEIKTETEKKLRFYNIDSIATIHYLYLSFLLCYTDIIFLFYNLKLILLLILCILFIDMYTLIYLLTEENFDKKWQVSHFGNFLPVFYSELNFWIFISSPWLTFWFLICWAFSVKYCMKYNVAVIITQKWLTIDHKTLFTLYKNCFCNMLPNKQGQEKMIFLLQILKWPRMN